MPQYLHRLSPTFAGIGRGAYGDVVLAEDAAEGGRKVAIKRVGGLFSGSFECSLRVYRELRILRHLQHPNIVSLRSAWVADPANFSELYLLFEPHDMDLSRLLRDKSQPLTIDHVRFFFYQLLLATAFMHSQGILHRDLKPANCLIDEDCSLFVCDFGLSASRYDSVDADELSPLPLASQTSTVPRPQPPPLLPPLRRVLTKHVQTRWFRAPELMLEADGIYDDAVDSWSLGCILAELLACLPPPTGGPPPPPRGALFPGATGPPLSTEHTPPPPAAPDASAEAAAAAALAARNQTQAHAIFSVLGRPDPEDARWRSEAARATVRASPACAGEDLSARFSGAPAEAVALLKGLLCMWPGERLRAGSALDHAFLAPTRSADAVAFARAERRPLLFPRATRDSIRRHYANELAALQAGACAGANAEARGDVGASPSTGRQSA